jgi:LysM repeat protein
MSAVEAVPEPPPSVQPVAIEPIPDALTSLCPYLATPDGNWRRANVDREHRCMAVSPPVQLTAEKQRRLCLVDSHVNCATYNAAVGAYPGPAERPTAHLRPIARMTPVILDQGRFVWRIPALRADRPSGQAVLVGLLGVALVAILLAPRPSSDAGAAGGAGAAGLLRAAASASPSARAAATDAGAAASTPVPVDVTEAPAATPVPSATAVPSSALNTPGPSVAPSPDASAQPVSSGATYRVKSGDTLNAIAARFGTTTAVLAKLNDIADPSRIRVGQIIRLP